MNTIDTFPDIPGPVAVLGAQGQVGSALVTLLGAKAKGLGRLEADLSKPEQLTDILDAIRPGAVINAAAYTAVDKAEEEEELARLINAKAPGVLALYCRKHELPFVHFSTDYVFGDDGNAAHSEEDSTWPRCTYGRTKREGEENIEKIGGKYLIFRTSWVYNTNGRNFLNTMIRLGREREEVGVVNDQFGAPTYAPDLAEASLVALERAIQMDHFPSGVYHLAGNGLTTWKGFAEMIFEEAAKRGMPLRLEKVKGIPSEDYPTPALRPKNSRLSMQKLEETFGVAMPDWRESLQAAMALKAEALKAMH